MIRKVVPAVNWLRNYKKSDLGGDLSAGLIVAIMLIPQGMAYAMLAGLPPVIGLYASTIPLIIYALFGSSRQLAVGPVAMVSLLVFSGISTLAKPGTNEYIALAILLAFMVGIIQLFLGLFRLGFLVNFLSHAVISGFTSASAIIIGLSQLKHLLGVKLSGGENVIQLLIEAFQKMGQTNLITLGIGLASIFILVLIKKVAPKIPGPLFVVVGSTLLVYLMKLDQSGVKIVGEVPQGIPSLSLPGLDLGAIQSLLPAALTISFIGFMESIAMAKAIASKEKYKVNSNQELIGLGLANIGGSFFSAYPVTGGFSRSAVNYEAGARTPLASIITAIIIVLTLLFFTPLFYYLPQTVLAAIIMVAVYGLIDVKEAIYLFKVKPIDGWTLVLTFVATLTLGIEAGILIGIVFSLLVFIGRSAYPHVAELGFLPEKNVYRNVKRYPEAKTDPEVLIFRVDASLYFANMSFLEDRLRQCLSDRPEVKWIIFDYSGVNAIDAVAIDSMEELMVTYQRSGQKIIFAGIKGPVLDLMKKAGWDRRFKDQISYLSIEEALQSIGK
ncbi:SulP family inorganic anion transporter [Hazenella coriacea]|uniref:SulP family sulfate permease n=1 Tax=Hazenella coriacea TaxID=1179467 RepID=A0A4V2UVU5_9BACL|nr:solute carrier family 26 protein [Hazenella coriacea]TCS96637.1 SulP family sulfate permease [Hazenella coriacea]